MLNPEHKLWRWGPIDGRPVYPDPWFEGLTLNHKKFPPGWPESVVCYALGKFIYLADYGLVCEQGQKVFTRFVLNDEALRRVYRRWSGVVKRFIVLNGKMMSYDLKTLSDDELYRLVLSWYSFYSHEFWGIGLIPELANLGGESLLLECVERKLGRGPEAMVAVEKLSAPEQVSFYQQEECDLLRLRALKDGALLERKLAEHQRRYSWLLNSYYDTRVLPLSYFEKRLSSFTKSVAKRKLRETAAQIRSARGQKSRLAVRLGLGSRTLKVARRLAFCIKWQDERKSYIFQANRTIDVILREITRRYEVTFEDLHHYVSAEVLALLGKGTKVSQSELARRKQCFAVLWFPDKPTRHVSGKAARKLFDSYKQQRPKEGTVQLRGQAVSVGRVRGRVRVLLSPKQSGKMKRGEILITTMTSPDFITAMRKAAAIVTDVGGITSHAAIVSRELRIPCIVGTHLATHVFKDGDRVEVDAKLGIVRKI